MTVIAAQHPSLRSLADPKLPHVSQLALGHRSFFLAQSFCHQLVEESYRPISAGGHDLRFRRGIEYPLLCLNYGAVFGERLLCDRREGSKLDLPVILDAAFAVLDESGFDGLSLRAVADRLEVQSPALYWHVKNRAELVTRMAVIYMDAAARSKMEGHSWSDMLLNFARGLRSAMLQHQDCARLCLAAQPRGKPRDSADKLAGPLTAGGLSREHALSYQAAVTAYTVGWVGYQQSDAMCEFLTHIIDFDLCFEIGLQAMVSGFENQQFKPQIFKKLQVVRNINALSNGTTRAARR